MSAPHESLLLQFDEHQLIVGKDTDIRNQLSAVMRDGDHIWLACDEGCRLERLSRSDQPSAFAHHEVFPLDTLFDLPDSAKEEADIEGLYADEGWLWLVGSHSVKRKKPKGESPSEVATKLLGTSRDGNRHLLARVPLVEGRATRSDGARVAASLPATPTSSALLDAVRTDPHLQAFVDIPGKDNGFDIEGLAARGLRVWVGLRGPVLREWCCILELRLDADGRHLRLAPDGTGVRKHFLRLDGLGVRDLALLDDDLLVLAGPTMGHDGPTGVWRWRNGAKAGAAAEPGQVRQVLSLPQVPHEDKAEGLSVFDAGDAASVLVVFDAPSKARKVLPAAVRADLFRL